MIVVYWEDKSDRTQHIQRKFKLKLKDMKICFIKLKIYHILKEQIRCRPIIVINEGKKKNRNLRGMYVSEKSINSNLPAEATSLFDIMIK